MEKQVYHIPQNIHNAGNILGGLIKLRNLIESIIVCIPIFFIDKMILFFINTDLTIKLTIYVVTILPFLTLTLIGIGDLSLFQYLTDLIMFKKRKKKIGMDIPTSYVKEEEISKIENKKETKKRKIINRKKSSGNSCPSKK